VNGKIRDKLLTKKDGAKQELEGAALALPKVRQMISGRTIRKIIIVPNRIVNVVVD
jgi:leucyl-tRNA synthetase